MKKKLLALMLAAGGSAFAATHFSVGVQLGAPAYYPNGQYAVGPPPSPGPGYIWIDGYTEPDGDFVPGYWALPPYSDAYWIAPEFYGGRFVAGYWGRRGGDRDDFRGGFDRDRGFAQSRGFDQNRGFARGFNGNRAPARVSGDQFRGGNNAPNNGGFRGPGFGGNTVYSNGNRGGNFNQGHSANQGRSDQRDNRGSDHGSRR